MNNSLQNPLQVLKAKSQEAWSGCIEFEEPKDASISWQVYLCEGKIQYVTTTVGQQIRLNYLWQQFKLGSHCPKLVEENNSEYAQLSEWLSNKHLTDVDLKKVLFRFIREGITHILSIEKTQIKLIPSKPIKKSPISFNLEQLKPEEPSLAWQQIRSYLESPFNRLYLEQKNALQFYKIWKNLYSNPELAALVEAQKLSSFVSLFVAQKSLYEIATKARINVYLLARYLEQSITDNIVFLLPFNESISASVKKNITQEFVSPGNNIAAKNSGLSSNETPISNNKSPTLIVCIDDSKAVQRQVSMTLEAAGYQVLNILDPARALKDLSKHQPAVIFLDINMPTINGYDLCSTLRKSKKFKEVPIVMLTGRDGMIDRVRAKLAGATEYLTKPCDPNKLIQLAKILEKSIVNN